MSRDFTVMKTALFGGFKKADVITYVEGLQAETAEVKEQLEEKRNESLELKRKIDELELRLDNLSKVNDKLAEKELEAHTLSVQLEVAMKENKQYAAKISEFEEKSEKYLNIIACENAIKASETLKGYVYERLDGDAKAYADKYVGFPNCSVDRIVPPSKNENPLDVTVENYYEWNVEEAGFKGEIPEIEGMNLVGNLEAYIERKLILCQEQPRQDGACD